MQLPSKLSDTPSLRHPEPWGNRRILRSSDGLVPVGTAPLPREHVNPPGRPGDLGAASGSDLPDHAAAPGNRPAPARG
jgi:hypothetical protein